MSTLRRSTICIAVLGVLTVIWPSQNARSEGQSKSRKAPKTERIRLEASNDPGKASRDFEAKWRAAFVVTPWPDYPYEARRSRITGKGLLRIFVDETGRVTEVKVLQSTGNRHLDEAGLTAFRRWRAKPGTRREVDMPLTFVLSGAQGRSGDTGLGNDGLGLMKSRDR